MKHPESDPLHDHHGHADHSQGANMGESVQPSSSAKYFCPMCEGVESAEPGDCPKCGMRLERNPAYRAPIAEKIWTCPMHPEVQQEHPGECPKCGMDLEPMDGGADEEEDQEINALRRPDTGPSTAGLARTVHCNAGYSLGRWHVFHPRLALHR